MKAFPIIPAAFYAVSYQGVTWEVIAKNPVDALLIVLAQTIGE